MKYKRYIKKFYHLVHKMEEDGLIDRQNKYVASNKVEIAIHELEQAFEQDISH